MMNDEFTAELAKLISRFYVNERLGATDVEVARFFIDKLISWETAIEERKQHLAQRAIDQIEWDAICAKDGHEPYTTNVKGELFCRQCGRKTNIHSDRWV